MSASGGERIHAGHNFTEASLARLRMLEYGANDPRGRLKRRGGFRARGLDVRYTRDAYATVRRH
jgi:hypothetical protein